MRVLPGRADVEARGFSGEFLPGRVGLFTARIMFPWSNVYVRLGSPDQGLAVTASGPLWMRGAYRKALVAAGFDVVDRTTWLPWAARNL
jgi:hypothetical protein